MTEIAGPKPQYRWDGEFWELPHTVTNMYVPSGVYVAVWNDYAGAWEFAEGRGNRMPHRIWDITHLPDGFRAGLLLVGVQ